MRRTGFTERQDYRAHRVERLLKDIRGEGGRVATFYEHQVPELLRQLARLNENLEEVGEALREDENGRAEAKEDGQDTSS